MSTQTFAATRAKGKPFEIIQPATTYTGAAIKPLIKGLPKITQSLCPECLKIIEAVEFEENGKVVMEKTCPEHGEFKDTIWSDVKLYLKMEDWNFGDNRGLTNPEVLDAKECPTDCGLCSMHTSHSALANLDLTNRCNLTCPICFANANASGYLYEPSFEQVKQMMLNLRAQQPVAGRIIQFSGGEPTIYPHFLDAVRFAKEVGFSHVQIATNGIRLTNLEFAQQCKEAGLHTLYLQLDGVSDDVYMRTRGEALWEKKLKVIENCKKADLKIVFVPTVVKGLNDHQVGDIVKLALANIDCLSGISFQPVAFTGRIARHELEEKRYTLTDLAKDISEQTGMTDTYEDWFPLSCVTPFSKLISALRGSETTTLTSHPHCAIGTYFFVDQNKHGVPVTRFIDVGSMLKDMDLLARKAGKATFKFYTKMQAWNSLRKHFHEDRAPAGLTFTKFLQTLQGMTDKRYGRGSSEKEGFTYKTLMVAGMHFMDSYNYDVERVKRCLIHYAAPDGKIYPFCTYNSGPCYREKIEKTYSIPFESQEPLRTLNTAASCGCGSCGSAK